MLFPSLYQQEPRRETRWLQDEMNRLFQSAGAWEAPGYPAMNVYASEDGIAVTAEIPGVSSEDLNVTVHRDTLTLKGERKRYPEDVEAYHRRERGTGSFARTIGLPFVVDPDKVEASYTNGVLRLSLQRPEEDKPKRITVRAS
jgi:HSP20 family protein